MLRFMMMAPLSSDKRVSSLDFIHVAIESWQRTTAPVSPWQEFLVVGDKERHAQTFSSQEAMA
jgi:hypothetical protein